MQTGNVIFLGLGISGAAGDALVAAITLLAALAHARAGAGAGGRSPAI